MKVLHILGYDEKKFNIPLIEMLSDSSLDWSDTFFFATNSSMLYEEIKHFNNTIYYQGEMSLYINHIYKNYDLIIIQGWNQSIFRASLLSIKAAKKIVWRFWGTDSFDFEKSDSIKTRILGKLFFRRLSYLISNFYAIGYGVSTDVTYLQDRFKTPNPLKGYALGFDFKLGNGSFLKHTYDTSDCITKDCLRVMVGHSANRRENHINTLKRLTKLKNDNIEIVLVVAYGNPEYRSEIIKFATQNFANKVVVQDKMMPYLEYVRFLNSIDIFAIESEGSNALGNLTLLMYLGKKIYVKKNSFLDRYLHDINADYFYVDNLEKESFTEMKSKNFNSAYNHSLFLCLEDDYAVVNDHKQLYNDYRQSITNEQ